MDSSSENREPLEALAEEFVERYRKGEQPPLSDYTSRFPEHAERIRRLFPTLLMMEKLAPGIDSIDGSEANDSAHREAAQPTPQSIGDFRILREIGRGGMGIVYEAVQQSLGRHVALKVLSAHSALTSRHLVRFRREAQAAAMLHHTNIVPVFDVGQSDGIYYYAMQFIQGLGLDEVLMGLRKLRGAQAPPRQGAGEVDSIANAAATDLAGSMISGQFRRPAPQKRDSSNTSDLESPNDDVPGDAEHSVASQHQREAFSSDPQLPGQRDRSTLSETGTQYFQSVARIGVQVASALEYAHQHNTLHRDIKPSNLLLDTQGVVWVTDFGLAKSLEQNDLTRTGEFVGTLRYMPPEQLESRSDARSDVYSLGLTLYELLTLQPAHDESDRARLLRSLTDYEPTRPRKRDATIPRDLETIVLKAIEREPKRRYQTAEELGADLQRFLEGKPILARQVGWGERTLKLVRRRPAVSSLACLLLLAIAAGFALVTWKWRDAEHQRVLVAQQAADNEALAQKQSELRRAAEAAQQAAAEQAEIARMKAATAEETAEFLIGLFQSSDPVGLSGYRFGPPPGDEVVPTAHDLLRRGTARVRSDLADAPEIQAAVMDHLGRTWLSLGSIADAEPLLIASLLWRQEHFGTDHPDTARSLAAMGMLRYIQGNYDEAVPLLRTATNIADKTLGPTSTDAGRIKFMFACVLLESRGGDPAVEEAVQSFQELVESLRPHASQRPHELAFALTGLAMGLQVAKDYQGALANLAEATVLLSSMPESDPVVGALILSVQAVTNWKLGNQATAQRETDECIHRFQELLGRDHPAVNYFQVYVARLIYQSGDLDRAESMLRQGVADAQRAYGLQPRTARTMKSLAELLIDRRQLDEAEAICQEALSIDKTVLGPDHRQTRNVQKLLSRIEELRSQSTNDENANEC